MSNQIDDLMPHILAQGMLSFRKRAVLPRLVNSDFSAEAARRGDIIQVPMSAEMTVQDVQPAIEAPTTAATTMNAVSVRLEHWKKAGFYLTDREMGQIDMHETFLPLQMQEAINALATAVNQSILDVSPAITKHIGSPASALS